jgi:DNA repair protein RecO (recombination protein O)
MKIPLLTEGLLIHKFPFQNSDLIVTWLTKDHGRIKTIAKGALRPGSPYQGRMDLYYQCEIQFISKNKSDIDTLKEVDLKQPHLGLRRDYKILQVLHYFSEIIESLTEPRTPIEPYYDLFYKALKYLNEKELRPELIERFEKRALHLAGIPIDPFTSMNHLLESNGYRVPKSSGRI